MSDTAHIEQFASLFAGLTRAKGRYVSTSDPSQVVVGEKTKGKATTVSEPVVLTDYARHLAGEVSLGIVPVRDDGTCVFGAIDIDQYSDIDHAGLATKVAGLEIPVMVCRSKSGGAHIYAFVNEPGIKAPVMIDFLKKTRTKLGVDYRKAREIFPKQKAQSGGIGNWINLPYFGSTPRRAVKTDGTDYTLEEFLTSLVRIEPSTFDAKTESTDGVVLTELPPCLERLVNEGIPSGMRNEAVFNFAVFATKKFQLDRKKVQAMIDTLNQRACQPPLSAAEVKVIYNSVISHDYNYKCDQPPIVDVCNKMLCQTRPYGPHAATRPSDVPEIEKIEAHGTETNETVFHVKLSISPKVVTCTSKQLFDYDLFRCATVDTIHMALPIVKKKDWDEYVTARFASLVVSVAVAPERSKKGLIQTMITDWVRFWATSDGSLHGSGRPYIEGNQIYLSYGDLCAQMKAAKGNIDFQQVACVLEEDGWEKTEKIIGGVNRNVWARAIDQGTDLPRQQSATEKVVDGHVVMEAPKDITPSLLQELTWEEFRQTEGEA